MIQSKEDYRFYLEADRIALGRDRRRPTTYDGVWKFQRLLRKLEYYNNCKNGRACRIHKRYLKFRFYLLSALLGYSIPPNVFGAGLSIAHPGTIVVNAGSKVGENCRLHVCVNIGTEAGRADKAPKIGNNVYIGPGAKIFGEIEISDDVAIGANAVVDKSVTESAVSIAGVPARKINAEGSRGLIIPATEILRRRNESGPRRAD